MWIDREARARRDARERVLLRHASGECKANGNA